MANLIYEERAGKTIQVDELRLTPISKVFQFTLPALKGGITWNRPVGVIVAHPQGETQRLPVPDITRQVILSFAFFSLTLLLIQTVWLLSQNRKKAKKGKPND